MMNKYGLDLNKYAGVSEAGGCGGVRAAGE